MNCMACKHPEPLFRWDHHQVMYIWCNAQKKELLEQFEGECKFFEAADFGGGVLGEIAKNLCYERAERRK